MLHFWRHKLTFLTPDAAGQSGPRVFKLGLGVVILLVGVAGLRLAQQSESWQQQGVPLQQQMYRAYQTQTAAWFQQQRQLARQLALRTPVRAAFADSAATAEQPVLLRPLDSWLGQQRVWSRLNALYVVDAKGALVGNSVGAPVLAQQALAQFIQAQHAAAATLLYALPNGQLAVLAPVLRPGHAEVAGYVVTVPNLTTLLAAFPAHTVAGLTYQDQPLWHEAPAAGKSTPLPVNGAEGWQLQVAAPQLAGWQGVRVTWGYDAALLAGVAILLGLVWLLGRREGLLLAELSQPRTNRHLLNTLVNHSPVANVVVNRIGRIERVNEQALEFFGGAPENWLGQPIGRLFSVNKRPTTHGEETVACRTWHGAIFDLRLRQEKLPDGSGWVLWLRDVEDDWSADLAQQENQRTRNLLNMASAWQWEMDTEGRFTWLSESVESLLGRPREDLLHRFVPELIIPADVQRFTRRLLSAISERKPLRHVMFRVTALDGEVEEFMLTGAPLMVDGRLQGFRGVATLPDRENTLPVMNRTGRDLTTGLWTPAALEGALEHFLVHAPERNESAMLAHFLVRGLGEPLSQQVRAQRLESATRALQEVLTPTETAAVLEPGRLAVLVKGPTGSDRVRRLMQLRQVIQQALDDLADGGKVSTGVVVLPRDTHESGTAMAYASMAAEAAREDGGECLRMFEASMTQTHQASDPATVQIRNALQDGAIEIRYQPIVVMGQTLPAAYECFPYLASTDGKVLRPAGYMPLLASAGAMEMFDQLALRRVLAQASKAEGGVPYALNLSAGTVFSPRSLKALEALVAQSGVAAERLIFEIAEEIVLADPYRSQCFISGLRRLGCRVAFDRFGGGMSALGLLRRFEVDFVKIDISLVRDLQESSAAVMMVKALASTAQSLGVAVVACGVETEVTYNRLRALGVDFVQGYYLGRPVREQISA